MKKNIFLSITVGCLLCGTTKAATNPAVDVDYRIRNVNTGLYLTANADGYLEVDNYDSKGDYQIFKLLEDATDATRYNLEINSQYLTHSSVNAWDILLGTSSADPLAELVLTTDDSGQTRIAVAANAGAKWVAPDKADAAAGTQCYTDKTHAGIEWVFEPVKFRIKNVATDLYMTNVDNVLKIEASSETAEGQIFKIDKDASDPEHFNISVDGKYLTQHAGNAWTVIFETNAADPKAEWLISTTDGLTKIQALGFAGTTKFLAPQNDENIYIDTDGGSKNEWILEPTSGGGVVEIVALTPPDGATGAMPTDAVTVTFNKPIAAKGDLSTITITNTANDIQLAGVLGVISEKVLTITHTDPLALKATYSVNIPAGVISGYDEAIIWTFTVASNPYGVKILSYTPTQGATVSANTPIEVLFNKNIPYSDELDGIVITDNGGNQVSDVFGWTLYSKLFIEYSALNPLTTYTVDVPEGLLATYPDGITWSFTTSNVTGIGNLAVNAKVYPTVTADNVTVETENPATIRVFSISGQSLATYASQGGRQIVNLSNQPNGVYLLKIVVDNQVSTHKVVKK
ncbi:hypothetical protein AGMMS49525_14840 [Bacteroidia bacterium]|nr:hypothetical protein AGMMS49525_14840 [Bacteroidia bacterium]